MKRLLCAALAVSATCLAAPAAQARIVHPPLARPGSAHTASTARQAYSTNWSGYATTTDTFTSATGSWMQPAVSCPRRGSASYSSFWVGLDGYNSGSVEQIGTDSDCTGGFSNSPSYYAWYELYPAGSAVLTGYPVSPGDTLKATVSSTSATSFTLTISDNGPVHSWTYSKGMSAPAAARSSAEWVAEAPSSCSRRGCTVLPLSDFGTVNFTGAQATDVNALTGPISSFTNQLIEMITPYSQPKAVPSALSAGGTAFSDTWAHS